VIALPARQTTGGAVSRQFKTRFEMWFRSRRISAFPPAQSPPC
jgi:hypothetical protein